MATSSAANEDHKDQNDERFECNICFEQAKDAVVSMCGHLFCWPCIHRWMEARSTAPTCPVCKSVIDKERLIPLYGRGSADKTDPRDRVPPRPQGQREEPPQQNEEGFGLDGIHVSFGIGAFPFTMLGGPMFQVFGNGAQRGAQRPANRQVREEEQRLAQIFITIAILVVIVILFA